MPVHSCGVPLSAGNEGSVIFALAIQNHLKGSTRIKRICEDPFQQWLRQLYQQEARLWEQRPGNREIW